MKFRIKFDPMHQLNGLHKYVVQSYKGFPLYVWGYLRGFHSLNEAREFMYWAKGESLKGFNILWQAEDTRVVEEGFAYMIEAKNSGLLKIFKPWKTISTHLKTYGYKSDTNENHLELIEKDLIEAAINFNNSGNFTGIIDKC